MPADLKSTLKTKNNPSEVSVVPSPFKEILSWQAAIRPFKKRGREYFSTVGAIVFLLVIILLFIKEWVLVAVVLALMFLSYVLATVPPGEVKHQITTRGIKTGEKLYKWEWLTRFWFTKKWNMEILNVETILVFPKRLQLILKDKGREEVRKAMEKYLTLEKPKKTSLDRASEWLQEKVPLES
ncbi:hypothetical protein COT75_00865 [Candidatus Beckwithbacteria bacterium CG10_big_fil_rev_8_21_14_0_10_34_10]|uniref:DUF5673 domain-containing protein n=1 Tax=Candidatus Beckwithbacteria bacterium CG10_big_fil_rev_8_21_14_0_10_34_10 TaxID=1974495 RepID=A0A2H0WA78_9BACT|nr:MAG: hypothetical protein COT75_00865 [Candidatus Beckwithbacteria bacterium CG10_big_fil_rev_8_21_14_0_10_34_10]